MHRLQRMDLALALVALLLAPIPHLTGATITRAFQCGGWSIVPSPNPYNANFLTAVAAVSASDVWAVGVGSLIEHWDGTSWQVVASPSAGASVLNAVTALSASDIWAVGWSESGTQTLIEHWNGRQWSIIPSPSGSSYFNYLASISAVATNDIWTVGYDEQSSGGQYRTLMEHWDGSHWSIVKSLNMGHNDTYLTGVSAVASNDVWVVGVYSVRRYQEAALALHWDGSRWSRVPIPGPKGSGISALTAVQADDIWGVGANGGATLIEHWNGQHWQVVKSPNPPGPSYVLNSVSAASATDVWTVSSYTANNTLAQTLTEHWNGTQWSIVPSPNMQDAAGKTSLDNYLNGVANVPGTHTFWAVGYYGPHDGYTDNTLIEYYC